MTNGTSLPEDEHEVMGSTVLPLRPPSDRYNALSKLACCSLFSVACSISYCTSLPNSHMHFHPPTHCTSRRALSPASTFQSSSSLA